MPEETKDIFDLPDDYKFPPSKLPDDTPAFDAGLYWGIVGRITPFFAGADGKKWKDGDTIKRLTGVNQDIWITSAEHPTEEKIDERISIKKDGTVEFVKQSTRGVRLFESFVTPSNALYDKLAWKAKQFYRDFPGVVIGDKGKKTVIWDDIKKQYGRVIQFEISYSDKKDKRGFAYRQINKVNLLTGEQNVYPIEVMAKIETLYEQLKATEKKQKDESVSFKPPDTNLSDVF